MIDVPRAEWAEGLLAGLAVVLAVGISLRRAPARGLSSTDAYRAGLCAAAAGLFCGNALHLAVHGGGSAADWIFFWSGSQSAFGVLAGAALGGAGYLALRGLSVLDHADLAAAPAALGYAAARAGCFLNGDDFGRSADAAWAVRYAPGTEAWEAHAARGWIAPDAPASLPVHPVQLYLAAAAVAIFVLLSTRRLPRGGPIGLAALLYGLARLAMEPLRDDFRPVAGPLSLPQLFALAMIAIGAGLLWIAVRSPRRAEARLDRPAETTDSVDREAPEATVREGGLRVVVAAVSTAGTDLIHDLDSTDSIDEPAEVDSMAEAGR